MKPNEHNTCENQVYCIINRTALVQMGDGRKLKCPVCDAVYDPDWVPPKTKEETYKEMLHRKYGWPS